MTDLPIVCTLDELALRERRDGLLADLVRAASGLDDLPDGLRMRFPAGQPLSAIARVVDAERGCCQFLRFAIAIEPGKGPVTLEVTGPPGTREFLQTLLPTPPQP